MRELHAEVFRGEVSQCLPLTFQLLRIKYTYTHCSKMTAQKNTKNSKRQNGKEIDKIISESK